MHPRVQVAGGLALLGLVGAWALRYDGGEAPPAPSAVSAAKASRPAPPPARRGMADDWKRLREACGGDPAAVRLLLRETRERWNDLPPDELAGHLAGWLASGEDAATGLAFEVGPGGSLSGWPTLRVFLLEMLADTDPDRALEVARAILAETDSAAEFAIALKPLLRGEPWRADEAELTAHLGRLLSRDDWQAARDPAFAEAFDLVRTARSGACAGVLIDWLGSSPPLADVGHQALDELAVEAPSVLLPVVAGASMSGPLRSGLMARADVADPVQREALDAYWRRADVAADERAAFLALFPHRSSTQGPRLYGGRVTPPDREAVVRADRVSLELLAAWRQAGTDPAVVDALGAAEARVAAWVAQAGD